MGGPTCIDGCEGEVVVEELSEGHVEEREAVVSVLVTFRQVDVGADESGTGQGIPALCHLHVRHSWCGKPSINVAHNKNNLTIL